MESIITQILSKFNMHAAVPTEQTSSPTPLLQKEKQVATLQEKLNFARNLVNNFFYFLVFFICISIAFFTGRSVKFMENKPNFTYETSTDDVKKQAISRDNNLNTSINVHTIVASKGGKKYYFVWCKGVENIKEQNKRYFANEAAAQKAGYTLAAACK